MFWLWTPIQENAQPPQIGILLTLKAGRQIALSLKRLLDADQEKDKHLDEEDRHYCRTGADGTRNVPALAQNETTIAGPVIATGTFNAGKNGQDTTSLTVSLPPR